jgi:hypothetical protein
LAELDRAQRKKDHDATWKKESNPYPLDMTDLLIEGTTISPLLFEARLRYLLDPQLTA